MKAHPELHKSRQRLFIPIKDNNLGKSPVPPPFLCGSAVPLWSLMQILTRARVSPRQLRHIRYVPLLPYCTCSQVDLQNLMKASRWSSRGTFTSFYLRDLCSQMDCLHKAGPFVEGGRVVVVT